MRLDFKQYKFVHLLKLTSEYKNKVVKVGYYNDLFNIWVFIIKSVIINNKINRKRDVYNIRRQSTFWIEFINSWYFLCPHDWC